MSEYYLVADIGGTNARFGVVPAGEIVPQHIKVLRCVDYPNIVSAINAYLAVLPFSIKPKDGVIAVASPVVSDQLEMTNHVWSFSIEEVRSCIGFRLLKVINDFAGLALAVPELTSSDLFQVGDGNSLQSHVKAIIGPGTGLGVSGCIPVGNRWHPLQGEGGHVSYGPFDEREANVIWQIKKTKKHVSAESLLSGAGLLEIYNALSVIECCEVQGLSPEDVSTLALNQTCPLAVESLSLFFRVLGTVAGDLALTLGARGGLYIGGGIVPKMLTFISSSDFRIRFEAHGRFSKYLSEIPTFVITANYPALMGCAALLRSDNELIGITACAA